MPRRLTNDLLVALLVAQVATGLAGWALPVARALPLYDLHRALGAGVLLVLVWKQAIARASLRRRLRRRPWDRSVRWGLLAGVALLASLGLGLAWTLDLVSFHSLGGYSPLALHAALGIGLLPLVLWHALRRVDHNHSAADGSARRRALRLAGLAAGSLLAWQLLARLAPAGGARQPTGSKHAGSFSGNRFPLTIWLADAVPRLDLATWRLRIGGKVARPGALSYAELRSAFPARQLQAVLDCTGGWWSEQLWQGVAVGDILADRGLQPGARDLAVTSVTGHRLVFPLEEARGALLATHVGGEPLDPGHGYPVRLAAPGRRGFHWVKWVGSLEVL